MRFAGAVGHDEILPMLRAADIFCLPSFSEGVPVVLMEAMAHSVPVVTTQIMGIPELVENERTGLLVAPGRVDVLVDALARLVADPELREPARSARDARRCWPNSTSTRRPGNCAPCWPIRRPRRTS